MTRRLLAGLEALAAGIVWAALVVGLAFNALTSPEYMTAADAALGISRTSGLTASDTALLSQRLRAFVADQDPGTLPAYWRGRPAFGRDVVSHMQDVRAAIAAGRIATGVAAGALAAYLALCVALRRRRPLADSMRAGALTIAIVGLLALAAGLVDFGSLFAAFHSLFFADGTWMFPYSSLLIRLLPERFWVAAGASWAALSATGAVALAIAARHVGAARGEEGSIRTVEDV